MTMPDMSTSTPPTGPGGGGQDTGTAGPATSARDQIRDVKNQVVGEAKNTLQDARDRATASLGESRTRIADQIGGVAQAFRRTGDQLRNDHQDRIAGLAETVAQQVDQVANYLRTTDGRAIRADVERLARRQPVAVIGGAFAVGLLAARFFKSSQQRDGGYRRPDDRYGREPYGGYAGAERYENEGYGSGGYGTGSGGYMSHPGGYNPGVSSGMSGYDPTSGTGGTTPSGGMGGGYAGS
jgi:hypothetical protein